MECLFGKIEDGEMQANLVGEMVGSEWKGLTARFSQIDIDVWTVMPNHFHGIVMIIDNPERAMTSIARTGEPRVRPLIVRENSSNGGKLHPVGTKEGSLGRIIQAFKSITTINYLGMLKESGIRSESGKLWHQNYYEHVIRTESDLAMIREYIHYNPLKWELDRFYKK